MLHMKIDLEDYEKIWANIKNLYLFCEIIFKNGISNIRRTNLSYK